MARVKPVEPRTADADDFVNQAKEYAFLKKQAEYLDKQMKELKPKLFAALEERGEVDSTGSIFIEVDNIDGVSSIKKERRVSRKIDELKAEEIIAAKNLEDKLYKTIRVVDEDALMAALYNEELTEEEVDEMYPQSVVWALVLKK